MNTPEDRHALLSEAIELARTGHKARARALLEQVIQADQYDETAWMWMATVVETDAERREALEIVLEINPANAGAREALDRLGGPRARRLAEKAHELAERIGGEALDERAFQPVIERPAEPAPAPVAGPEPTPEEIEAEQTRRLVQAVHEETLRAQEQAAAQAAPAQAVEYYDFAGEERRRRFGRMVRLAGTVALILVGAGLVAGALLGLSSLLAVQPPAPPTPTLNLATALALLATPTPEVTPTLAGVLLVTRSPQEVGALPATWTPSFTPNPTATHTPSPQPPAPAEYRLIFSRRAEGEERYSLYAIRGDGREEVRLTGGQTSDRSPAPAADGQRVAFASDYRGGREVVLARLDALLGGLSVPTAVPAVEGQTPVAAASGPIQAVTGYASSRLEGVSWSSDGFRIAFSANFDGDDEIYLINADGTGLVKLTDNTASDRDPAWSPNGLTVVFASDRDGAGQYELYSVEPNAANLTRLTDSAGSNLDPAWSPDSRFIVFVSDRDRDADLYIMNADGTNERLLTTNDPAEDRYPAWSPDGRWIAYSSNRESTNPQIYLIDPYGERIVRVTAGSGDDVDPAWMR